jgi:hypothetical protein
MNATTTLNDAFAEAREYEQRSTSKEAQLARLRAEAPDLADLVAEERLTIPGAFGELAERNAAVTRVREGAKSAARELGMISITMASLEQGIRAGERALTAEIVSKVENAATHLKRLFEEQNNGSYSDTLA